MPLWRVTASGCVECADVGFRPAAGEGRRRGRPGCGCHMGGWGNERVVTGLGFRRVCAKQMNVKLVRSYLPFADGVVRQSCPHVGMLLLQHLRWCDAACSAVPRPVAFP